MRGRSRPTVEPFEDRIPIAESVGLILAMRALADAASASAVRTTLPSLLPPTHKAFDGYTEAGFHGFELANGLTDASRLAVFASPGQSSFEATSRAPDADGLFAALDGGDETGGRQVSPAEPHGTAGPDTAGYVSFTSLSREGAPSAGPSPAFAPTRSLAPNTDPFSSLAPAQDRALQQAVNTAAAAPSRRLPSGSGPDPIHIVSSLTPAGPPGGSSRPLTAAVGRDGIIPELECGGCSPSLKLLPLLPLN
jgi:hypothetical protein